ncbi:hypothetical protein BOX15_Mlig008453g1 [Macrostomum lignano]|uniref:Kazal-like domain-containing protein n=2 Tax=Macrostomum lignano TaxID=282301 RepID=A0A1I8HB23_9PLAT|nr:hypothetical protein BOX15_Mlig002236g1 [Macrostomum lignano]PAA79169.1 hypothetical protein BOX15_Mlig008453g2 [Macrostomum lignano]PAA86856.1 hypothetical protein BOX15_Mlig008453g1 [Macrostomum lignano]
MLKAAGILAIVAIAAVTGSQTTAKRRVFGEADLQRVKLNSLCTRLCRNVFNSNDPFCVGDFLIHNGHPDCVCSKHCRHSVLHWLHLDGHQEPGR